MGDLYLNNQSFNKQIDLMVRTNSKAINDLQDKIAEKDKIILAKDGSISSFEAVSSTTRQQYENYVSTLPEFVEFSSKNKKLNFLHNKNWICREIVTDRRVDCYPSSRQGEEYDMGLDEPGVYFADLTMEFYNCGLTTNQNINGAPIKVVREDVGTFYVFNKNFNGCEVPVTSQNTEIDTEKKLYKILH
jgi:hypothetical protein